MPVYEASPTTGWRLDVIASDTRLGVLGRVNDEPAEKSGVRGDVLFLELDWASVSRAATPGLARRYAAFSRHPVVDRDLAVAVGRDVAVGNLTETIRRAGGDLLSRVDVFDLYEGDQIEHDKKSVAFSVTFATDRTLRDKEVDDAVTEIVSALKSEHGAILRR